MVVLAVMMPGEIECLQALKVIKADPELKSTYVILGTARGQADALAFASKFGADAYFIKPFSPLALASHSQRVLPE